MILSQFVGLPSISDYRCSAEGRFLLLNLVTMFAKVFLTGNQRVYEELRHEVVLFSDNISLVILFTAVSSMIHSLGPTSSLLSHENVHSPICQEINYLCLVFLFRSPSSLDSKTLHENFRHLWVCEMSETSTISFEFLQVFVRVW